MQSKNAIGNLINRYKAVLKKCRLLNTFGSLALAATLATGGVLAMPALNVASFADTAYAASVATTSGDGYIIEEVTNAGKTYFKKFSVNDGTSTTEYGILFKGTDYPTGANATHSSIDKLVADVITAQKSGVPADHKNYFKEIVEVNYGEEHTFTVTSKNASGTDVTLYFAVMDASGNVITKTNNRIVTALGSTTAQIFDNFIGHSGIRYGGAINNAGIITTISNSTFVKNIAQSGGAIYNSENGTIESIIASSFMGNSATEHGGAIYNAGGTIESIIASSFMGNSATEHGGAIYNAGGTIESIIASSFMGNSATGQFGAGGAIYNAGGTIESIIASSFMGNSATEHGGAIYNAGGTIESITASSFTGDALRGGAIYNAGGTIKAITASSFMGNSADHTGGAIYNYSGTIESIIASSFIGNSATGQFAAGGAIYNYSGTIESIIASSFMGNSATGQFAAGGAIYNSSDSTIESIIASSFMGNSVTGDDSLGGAIYNNAGTIESIIASSFMGNSAADKGGAIYNSENGTINFIAANNETGGLTLFSGNTDSTGSNAIRNENGTVNFNAGIFSDIDNSIINMGIIDVQDYISGKNGTININGTVYKADGTTEMTASIDGLVMLNQVSGNNLELHNGTLSFANGQTGQVFSGGSFDTAQNSILYLDADLGNDTAAVDTIDSTFSPTVLGTVGFRIMSDDANKSETLGIFTSASASNFATAYTNDYTYNYASDAFTRSGTAGDNNGLKSALEATGTRTFSLTSDYTDAGGTFDDGGNLTLFGNVKDALADSPTDINGNIIYDKKYGTDLYSSSASIGVNNAAAKLNVIDMLISNAGTAITNTNGNVMVYNSVFDGNATALENSSKAFIFNSTFSGNTARAIENTGTLQLSNVNFINNEHTEKGAAIYSTGDITLQAQAGDYIISGNTTTNNANNAIYLDGAQNLNFQLDAGASYTLDDNVQANGAYTVNVNGSGVLNLNNTFIGASAINVTNTTLNLGTASYSRGNLATSVLTVTNGRVNINTDATMQGDVKLISSILDVQNGNTLTLGSGLLAADTASTIALSGGTLSSDLSRFGAVDLSDSVGSQFEYILNIDGDFTATSTSNLTLTGGEGGFIADATLNALKGEIATDIFGDSSLASIIDLTAFKTPDEATLSEVNSFIQAPTETIGAGNLIYKENTEFAAIRTGDSKVKGAGVNLTLTGQGGNTTLAQGTMEVSEGAHLTLGVDASPEGLTFNGDITVEGDNSKLTVAYTDVTLTNNVILTSNADLAIINGGTLQVNDVTGLAGTSQVTVGLVGTEASSLVFAGGKTFTNAADIAASATDAKYAVGAKGSIDVQGTARFDNSGNMTMAEGGKLKAQGFVFVAGATLSGGDIEVYGAANSTTLSGALTVNNATSDVVINVDNSGGSGSNTATVTTNNNININQGTLDIQKGTLALGDEMEFGDDGTLQIASGGTLDISDDTLTANLQDFGTLTPNGYKASFTEGGTVFGTLIGDAGTSLILNGAAGEITMLDNYNALIAQMKIDIFGADYTGSLSIAGYGQYNYLTAISSATHEPDNPIAAGDYKINETSTFAGIAKDVRHDEENSTITGGGTLNLTGNTGNVRILSEGNITVTDGNLNLGYNGTAGTAGGKIKGDLTVTDTTTIYGVAGDTDDVTIEGLTKVEGDSAKLMVNADAHLAANGALTVLKGTLENSGFVATTTLTVGGDSGATYNATANSKTSAETLNINDKGVVTTADGAEFSVNNVNINEGGTFRVSAAPAADGFDVDAVTVKGASAVFDVDESVAIGGLALSNNGALDIAAAKTLTVNSTVALAGDMDLGVKSSTLKATGFSSTGNVDIKQGVIELAGAEGSTSTLGGDLTISGAAAGDQGGLVVTNGTLSTGEHTLTVSADASTFQVDTGGILETKASNFGTFTTDGTVTKVIGKTLDNDGELILTGLADSGAAFENGMSRSAKAQLKEEAVNAGLISGNGTISYADVDLNGLYSLTFVDEADIAFQNDSQNIMAGDLTGNRTVNAAGIEENTDETDSTKAITSSIAANNTLNLSGKNTGNILLDKGSLTNNGTLNLGHAEVASANFNGALNSSGTTNIVSHVNFGSTVNITGGTTTFNAASEITGATTVNGGSLVVNAADKTVTTKNVDVASGAGLTVTAGTLDVSGGTLTVANDASTTFATGADGTLKAQAEDFGDITQAGAFTKNGTVEKQLTNAGDLILTDVGFSEMSKAANAKLQADTNWKSLVTGGGDVILQNAGQNVDLTGLYSLTWVVTNDQLSTDNIMAGTLDGQTVTAAGIVKNTDENPNVTASTIAADSTLNLSGDNDGNILLDEGSVTNSGTLNLGVKDADYTSKFDGVLTSSGTTNILSSVTFGGNVNVTGGTFDLQGGVVDASSVAFTTANGAILKSSVDTTLMVDHATIGKDADGITNIAATVDAGTNVDNLLGGVTVKGFTATMDYGSDPTSDYGLLRTAGQDAFGDKAAITFDGITLNFGNVTLDDVIAINDNTLGGHTIKMGTQTHIPNDKNIAVGAISHGNGQTLTVGGGLAITGNTASENDGYLFDGNVTVLNGGNADLGAGKIGDITVNTGGNVAITGNGITSAGATTLGGTLHVANGSSYETTDLDFNGGLLTAGSNIQNSVGGSVIATGTTTMGGGMAFFDPAWVDGVGIEGASVGAFAKFTNDTIDGDLVAGQNSYIVIGDASTAWAKQSFKDSGLQWGQSAITAALFINKPHTLDAIHGGIRVDGSLTAAPAALANNTAIFASGSLLVVNANNMAGQAALSANVGTLTVASTSKLVISGGDVGTVKVVSGFTNAASTIATNGWGYNDATLTNVSTDSETLKIDSVSWDGGVFTATLAQNAYDVDGVDPSVSHFMDAARDAGARGAFFKFLDDTNVSDAEKVKASVVVPQTAIIANVARGTMNAAMASAQAITLRNNVGTIGTQKPTVVGVNDDKVEELGKFGVNAGSDTQSSNNGFGLWLMPLYKWSNVGGIESGVLDGGYKTGLGGLSLGADYTFDNNFRLGVAFNVGAGYTESTGDFSGTDNDFDFWGLSLYAGYEYGNLNLSADVGYSASTHDVTQKMGTTGYQTDIFADVWTAGFEAAYTFKMDFMNITPHVGVRYMGVNTYEYDIADLNMDSDHQRVWYFPVGVTISKDIITDSGWTFTPKIDLGFIAATGDLKANSTAGMASVNATIQKETINVDSFAFNGGLGIELMNANKDISLGLNYNIQASEHETAHMVNAVFRYEF